MLRPMMKEAREAWEKIYQQKGPVFDEPFPRFGGLLLDFSSMAVSGFWTWAVVAVGTPWRFHNWVSHSRHRCSSYSPAAS